MRVCFNNDVFVAVTVAVAVAVAKAPYCCVDERERFLISTVSCGFYGSHVTIVDIVAH